MRKSIIAASAGILLSLHFAPAQSFPTWTGGAGTANFGDTGNWSGGNFGNYGQAQFTGTTGSAGATLNNNTASAQSRLYFSGATAYTLNGNAISLFDFGSPANWFSWVLSDSTANQTINLTINFAATAGPTFGQISARSSGNLTFNNVGITGSQVGTLRISGASGSTGQVNINGVLSGSGKSVIIGLDDTTTDRSSTFVNFNAANTYSGDTFVVAGTLNFGQNGNAASSIIRLGQTSGANGATVRLGSTTGGGNVTSTLVVRPGSSGVKNLTSVNTSGTNTYAGGIFLDDALSIQQSSGGTLALTGGVDVKGQTLSITGAGGTVNVSSVIQNSTGAGQLVVGTNGIVGSGGTVNLSAANTYSGDTFVRNGTLQFTGSGNAANSTIRLGSTSGTAVDATINLGTATGGVTVSSVINPVTTSGSGTLVLSSTNTSGNNTFSGHIGLDRNLTVSSVNSGGTLILSNTRVGVTTTTGIDIKGNTLTFANGNSTGGNTIVSGTIYNSAGSGGVTIGVNASNTASVTLSGNNTYVGATTVNSGTLLVTGSTASGSNVSVAANANLGGTGTIGGATTMAGNLSAGNGGSEVGLLSFGNTLNLSTAQNVTFQINGTNRGANYDAINVSGALTNGGDLVLSFGSAFTPPSATIFNLFSLGSTQSGNFGTVVITGAYSATLVRSGSLWTGVDGTAGRTFSYDQTNGNLTVIPEPSTFALLALGLTAVVVFRRRRSVRC
ncbi:MAG: autotransporter-associated beta strand repeat-containing protein [Terrimicrobiaceae bacterium]|nr:autotransporter-associated beta strand repeat-containing protein [Terrimicrobiaceae bacterium]